MSSGEGLRERDLEILNHIHKHHLTVPEAVHRLFFSEANRNAVTKVLSRLQRSGHLKTYDLYHRRRYWRLSPKAASTIYADHRAGEPLKLQSIVEWFGVLAFCSLGETRRELIARADFLKHFPAFHHPGFQMKYFIDEQDRLGYIHIDHGTRIDYIARQVLKQVHKRRKLSDFRKLMDGGQFVFWIVTRHEDREEQIRRTLSERNLGIPFEIEVQPEMNYVMHFLRDKK
jgi:hypothetical protein